MKVTVNADVHVFTSSVARVAACCCSIKSLAIAPVNDPNK